MWAAFLGCVVTIVLAIEVGYRVARRRRHPESQGETPEVKTIVGALLALLAFILAITFGAAASRFDGRRALVVAEANAIGAAYLRADLLPSSYAAEAGRLLREYVDTRLAATSPATIEAALSRSEELQEALWEQAVSAAHEAPTALGVRLFIPALSTVFELHEERIIAGVRNRIPPSMWALLYLVAFIAMAAVGYDVGLCRARQPFVTTALALAFSLVLLLILDLDRPQAGLLTVSQQAMTDLQERLN